MAMMKRAFWSIMAGIVLLLAGTIAWQRFYEPDTGASGTPRADAQTQISRGLYLARAANCMTCHTARGGQPYAGGRIIATPFGSLVSPNITPDPATGIGSWSADDFWRAIHNGKSKDGSFLYPAFPYPSYTKITRADSDDLYAYLRTIGPVKRPNEPHALRFPYDQRVLLAFWRALYFRPGVYRDDPSRGAEWNRGAYLVQGPGHCSACHTGRNALGATVADAELAGGTIPMLDWYASPLTSDTVAGLGGWSVPDLAALLKTGVSPRGTVFGPMNDVVKGSLQYLNDEDVRAMSAYLKSLPKTAPAEMEDSLPRPDDEVLKQGASLYRKYCVECHKENGAGSPPAYPPLAGNRAVEAGPAINAIRIVLNGGYSPVTTGNPRPYGMPPFGPALNDAEVAAVVSYMRNAWGKRTPLVSPAEVTAYRTVPLE